MIGLNIAILVTLIMTDKKSGWVTKHLLLPYADSLQKLAGRDVLKILIYHALLYFLNLATILVMIYIHEVSFFEETIKSMHNISGVYFECEATPSLIMMIITIFIYRKLNALLLSASNL